MGKGIKKRDMLNKHRKISEKIRREENKNRKMKGKGYLSSLGAITKENTMS